MCGGDVPIELAEKLGTTAPRLIDALDFRRLRILGERPTCVLLPGIIAPAVVRFAPLIREIGVSARADTKELEVYALSPPPAE